MMPTVPTFEANVGHSGATDAHRPCASGIFFISPDGNSAWSSSVQNYLPRSSLETIYMFTATLDTSLTFR